MLQWSWDGIEKVIMFAAIGVSAWLYLEMRSLNAHHNYT